MSRLPVLQEISIANFFFQKTMSSSQPAFDYTDESQQERLAKKAKNSPFMIIGKL